MSKAVIFQRALIFLIGLFFLDQLVLRAGDKFVDSPFWGDPVIYGITAGKPRDAYILGTCRAALVLDPGILESATKSSFFNAGRVVDGLGNMEFTLGAILSHVHPKMIAIVLDTELLMETLPEVKADLAHREVWWSALNADWQNELLRKYDYNRFFLFSGIWKYRGTGNALLKAAVRMSARKPVPERDAYDPYPVEPNLGGGALNEALLRTRTRQSVEQTEISRKALSGMVEKIAREGIIPIIIVPPMHRLYASEKVNQETMATIREIAAVGNARVLDHLTDSRFTGNDRIWTNTSHLNLAGAELFSHVVALELRGNAL